MAHLTIPIRGEKLALSVAVKDRIHRRKTKFQEIDVVDTDVFGRILLLDGHIQLSELDEHAYHECLVHIPMLSLGDPHRALVIGGGDGGVLRELCRHDSIKHIDMVEIDAGVIEASREHLPFVSHGAFDDPRVIVHIGDAFEFVKDDVEAYDLIVMDSTDVYEDEEGALSERLFSHGFYKDCQRLLSAKGMVVTQADNPVFCPYSLEAIQADFRRVFAVVGTWFGLVPSFGGYSAFCFASNGSGLAPDFIVRQDLASKLRYLNAATYALALNPPHFGPGESVATQ